MKFLHVADLHIGSNRSVSGFLERQEAVYDQIFKAAIEHKVDALVVAGDIWHQPVHPSHEKNLWLKKLLQYDNCGFKIIQIAGNHDYLKPGMTHLRQTTYQAEIGNLKNLVSADIDIKYYWLKDYCFLLMPDKTFHTPDFNNEVRRRIQDLQESSFDLPTTKGVIVVAHFAVKGCAADVASMSGQQFLMEDGVEIADDLPVTYIALGDLHIQQKVGPRCYYSGSPLQTRWGEDPEKGGLLVDTEDPDNPTSIFFKSKPMLTFYEPPDEWPDPNEAFIRLITDKEPPEGTPKEVRITVKLPKQKQLGNPTEDENAPNNYQSYALFDTLKDDLGNRGVPDEYVDAAMTEAKDIATAQGISIHTED